MLQKSRLQKQDGAVLLVSLMFLLILTILGISSMQSTVMEEKMAGNNNDYNRAFQASEAGLRAGEKWIQNRATKPIPNNTGSSGVWTLNALFDSADVSKSEWWQQIVDLTDFADIANVKQYTAITGINTAPYYVTEENSFIKDNLNVGTQADNTGRTLYRITSRGTGGVDSTRVFLQTTYSKRY